MRIRTLGRSGLRVSDLCLGAMTFGMPEWGCDERESLALIDRYLAAGGNFIDTADAYSGTISEEICGKAMAGRRTQIVLATEATMPVGSGPNDREAARGRAARRADYGRAEGPRVAPRAAGRAALPVLLQRARLRQRRRAGCRRARGRLHACAARARLAAGEAGDHVGDHRSAEPRAARGQPGCDGGARVARDHDAARGRDPHRARVPGRLHRLHPDLAR